jgi:amino acid transporter
MSMSRDGLLPPVFSKIHPRFKTPSFSTILTGIVVGGCTLFVNLKIVLDMTSIGTLFAFALVCGGVLMMEKPAAKTPSFKVPYYNSKYIIPFLTIGSLGLTLIIKPDFFSELFKMNDPGNFHHRIPMLFFLLSVSGICILCWLKDLSLIPVLGLICNLYLMTELGVINWLRFIIWLIIGLVIYFLYGYKHSRLGKIDS